MLDARPIDYGIDKTLIREQLKKTPEERLELKASAVRSTIEGAPVLVASLDHLIAMKEATGRPKDRTVAAELRAISDELRA